MKRRGFFKAALALVGLKALGITSNTECTKRIWRIETFPGKTVFAVDNANKMEHQAATLLWCQVKSRVPEARLAIERLVTSSCELTE